MFLDSTLPFRGRFGVKAFPMLVVLFSLLGGCTAKPILRQSDDQAALPTAVTESVNKASYNKPYRIKGKTYSPMLTASGYKMKGTASWYGAESGNRTASGARFNPRGLTAAHKTLPIPSKVRVTNLSNGRYVDVVINDRGPFVGNRLIDLSQGAAKQIGMHGLAEVMIECLDS